MWSYCFHAGAGGKANDAAGGQGENQARVSYSGFHGSLRVDWLRLAVERASTAGVNSIFRLSRKCFRSLTKTFATSDLTADNSCLSMKKALTMAVALMSYMKFTTGSA